MEIMEYKDYCGTFTVRIDTELHFKIYLLSEKEDRSLNKTVERLLRKAIETMENE